MSCLALMAAHCPRPDKIAQSFPVSTDMEVSESNAVSLIRDNCLRKLSYTTGEIIKVNTAQRRPVQLTYVKEFKG